MYRRGSEQEADEKPGGPRTFASVLISTLDLAAQAYCLQPDCESPIEVMLGAQLKRDLEELSTKHWIVIPQWEMDRFRFDFAILEATETSHRLVLLIECDGREFHSTPEQKQRDATKTQYCVDLGVPLLRFTGREIYRDARFCVEQVYACLGITYGT